MEGSIMKIASREHSSNAFVSHNQLANVGSRSFARLLEDGGSARIISSTRARSFSEAGLLGLHFSVNDVKKAINVKPNTLRLTAQTNLLQEKAEIKLSDFSATSRLASTSSIETFSNVTGLKKSLNAIRTTAGDAHIDTVPTAKQSLLIPDDGQEVNPTYFKTARVCGKMEAQGSCFRVDVMQSNENAIIVVHCPDLSEDDILEIEYLAQLITKLFGVNFDRLIIHKSKSER
jgi:hypothetical protein